MPADQVTAAAPLLTERRAVAGEVARFGALARGGFWSAVLLHMVFLAAFLHLGEDRLAAFNLASLGCYAVCLLLLRRGFLGASMILATAEVVAHQIWVTRIFGLDSGFQYYLVVLPIAAALLPTWRLWQRLPLALFPLLVLLALMFDGRLQAPLRPPAEAWQQFFLLLNVSSLVVVQIFVVLAYATAARDAETALEGAYAESESLLARILPASVAARLKQRPEAVADRFDDVTILFADIVGFTGLAEQRSPVELVVLLDRLIGEFDRLAAEHGVEKIKTLGDAWMGAAGAPEPRGDHAERAARLALAMLDAVARLNRERDERLELRIGMASGSVVAGVIGQDKFAYDLWGDTVNLAARMESEGLKGEIQVAESTRALLSPHYELEARAPIEIKGKGRVQTYLLRARRPAPEA